MSFFVDTRQLVTYIFVGVAILIVTLSLLFSNKLTRELAQEERNKIEIWAEATRLIATDTDNNDMNLILHILQSNTTIPVILHDVASDVYVANNIKITSKNTGDFLRKKSLEFAKRHDPIILDELNQYLYYDDSYTLKQLSVYPYVQLSVMFVFVVLAFFTLRASLKSEQNRVWVGLSKETAHQLGTPISSLMAWIELLKLKNVEPELVSELDKDMRRLEVIAERFSKIGSVADMKLLDIRVVVEDTIQYMKRRVSDKVSIKTLLPDDEVLISINEPLFVWVIENLVKNATDAMSGQGVIYINIFEKGNKVVLDFKDSGKGIERSKYNQIFHPGYTTKDRGWGLGLSLVRRIVEEYHKGKIYVENSEVGKGTTFRVILNAAK